MERHHGKTSKSPAAKSTKENDGGDCKWQLNQNYCSDSSSNIPISYDFTICPTENVKLGTQVANQNNPRSTSPVTMDRFINETAFAWLIGTDGDEGDSATFVLQQDGSLSNSGSVTFSPANC